MSVLTNDETLARSKEWLSHCPAFIRRAYASVRDIDWLCPCVICSSKTQRLALVKHSPLKKRTVAYICGDCIHHSRFERIRRKIIKPSEENTREEEEEAADESSSLCPTMLKWCGMN